MDFTSDDAFNAVLYGSAGLVNYANPAFNNIIANVKGAAVDLFNKGVQLYHKYQSNTFIDQARSVIKNVMGVTTNMDTIQPYFEHTHFKLATLTMQRWIMACPVVRQEYHAQQIDGYAQTYVDVEPDAIKHSHYDYQLARNGFVEDDGSFVNYAVDLKKGDRHLTLAEQSDIDSTWARAQWLLSQGLDPTDPTA